MSIGANTPPPMWTYFNTGPFKTKHFGMSTDTQFNEGEYGVLFISSLDPSRLIKKSDSKTLINEYTIGRKIDHPNFMKVYRLFKKVYVDENGNRVNWKYKLEIERIFGKTLGNALAAEKIDRGFYLKLTEAMCNGIIYLNHQKIAWGDIRSENIMVSDDGEIKFIDFGLYVEVTDDAKRIKKCLKNYGELVVKISEDYQMSEDAEVINKHIEDLLVNKRKELKNGASPEQTLTSFLDQVRLCLQSPLRD